MAVPQEKIFTILEQNFPGAKIIITDLVGDQDHYSLEISSESFKGLPLIKQHKLVKNALSELLKKDLHAITIKTKSE